MVRIRRTAAAEIGELHRRMEQVVDRLLFGSGTFTSARGWAPRSDIHETSRGMIVTLEIPGVERDEIEIVIDGNYLRVSGHREEPTISGCVRWHQMEIAHGPFERVIALPFEADPAGITATYRDGFLRIEIERGGSAARTVPVVAR